MKTVFEQQAEINIEVVDGYQEIELKDCISSTLHLLVDKHRRAQVFITYTGVTASLDFQITLKQGSSLALLNWSEIEEQLVVKQNIQAEKDSVAHFGYSDLSGKESQYHIHVDLMDSGSEVTLTSTTIAQTKEYHVDIQHHAPHTSGDMHHYAIVDEGGKYTMEASGIIKKGAHDSISHQATHVLTMSDKQTSEVTPILLIDENDVKASHATTLGQPDEHQLYYLQSRGLTRQQALGLLTIGYVLPICEVIDNEELKTRLQNKIEEKVIKHV